MKDLFSPQNKAMLQEATETLKSELSKCFSAEEQHNSHLELRRVNYGQKHLDLFSANDEEELIRYIKGNNSFFTLVLCKQGFVKKSFVDVADFQMKEMPGCCGIVVSTGARTKPKFQKRGIGTALNKFRIALARATGYATMVCTAVDDGITEKILARNGWQKLSSFINRRTNNKISLYSINV